MKKYLVGSLAIILLILAVTYMNPNKVSPDETKIGQQEKLENFGGSKDVKLYPVDEGTQDESLAAFRSQMLEAAEEKDLDFLQEHLHESIKYSFGINEQKEGFFRKWDLDTNPAESRFWNELTRVLSLGGTFNEDKTIFTAPYVFTSFPEDLDAFQHAAIIDENVKVYSEPSNESLVIGELDYSIVRVQEIDTKTPWSKVENLLGKSGYVLQKYVRSPIDYRGSFQKIDDTWKLIFFVAGD